MKGLHDLLEHARDRRTIGEFLRFSLTGVTNSIVDFGLYYAMTRGFAFWMRHLVAASALAGTAAVTVSFLLNNFWTFRRDGRGWFRRSIKFLIVTFSALGIHVVAFSVLVDLGMHDLVAKVVGVGLGGVWNFTLYKFWAFAERA